jgi:hypothetical protein
LLLFNPAPDSNAPISNKDARMIKNAAPERTFDRGRGCHNCVSFSNEEMSRSHWLLHKMSRLAQYKGTIGLPLLGDMENPNAPTKPDPRLKQLHDIERLVNTGCVGICLKGARPASMGGPEGDFIAFSFLCDRWTGREGHSLATAGRPLDKLNEELAIIADERAEKV